MSDFAVAAAVKDLAEAVREVARALDRLGLNNAATQMGAIELLSKEVKEGLEGVKLAIDGVSV